MMVMMVMVVVVVVVTVPERQRKHDARTMVVVMMMVMMVMIRELHIARIGRRTLLLVDRLQRRAGVRDRLQEVGIGMGL